MNNLIVYADNYLLAEVFEALVDQFGFTLREADKVLHQISPFIIIKTPKNIYRLAKDPEDNYLYDICIQNNCQYLITIDKLLIKDHSAPFLRKTDAWLKKRKIED